MNNEDNKKLRKVFEDMVDQLQQGQINVADYENGEILVEGYKQAVSDSLDYLAAQFPQMKQFAKEIRDEVATFDLFLKNQDKQSETTDAKYYADDDCPLGSACVARHIPSPDGYHTHELFTTTIQS